MPNRRLLAVAISQLLMLQAVHAATITVNSPSDGVPTDDGVCTLREAIENANTDSDNGRIQAGECAAGSGFDRIVFDPKDFAEAQILTLSQGQFDVTSSLEIVGPGRDRLTIDAAGLSRHFFIDDGDPMAASDVSLSGMTLTGGAVVGASGGAIESREHLTLTTATLTGNTVTSLGTSTGQGRGGGLSLSVPSGAVGVDLTLDEVWILDNEARNGGGLSVRARGAGTPSTVVVENSRIEGNRARPGGVNAPGSAGGELEVSEGSVVLVRDSVIRGNDALGTNAARVGGLSISAQAGSSVLVERVEVVDNLAGRVDAGGDIGGLGMRLSNIGSDPSTMRLVESTISGNQAFDGSTGGLEFIAEGPGIFSIERSTISGNVSDYQRGGVFVEAYGSTVDVIDSTISGNRAGFDGGGIEVYAYSGEYSAGAGHVTIQRCTIVGNRAGVDPSLTGAGGGLFSNTSSNGVLTLTGSIVAGNADDQGTPDLAPDPGLMIDLSTTLIGDNTGTGWTEAPIGAPDVDGNLIGDPAGLGLIDPLLEPLADNGGTTLTHRPGGGSPVIDAAGTCTGTDQRGLPRPLGPACDMGAVEVALPVDLSLVKTSGSFFTAPGGALRYTLLVRNDGPADALQARIVDTPPSRLGNLSWTCNEDQVGALCSSAAGTGPIDLPVDLAAGTSVTVVLDATLLDLSNDPITNTATVIAPVGLRDVASANNSDSDTDLVGLFADGMESEEP